MLIYFLMTTKVHNFIPYGSAEFEKHLLIYFKNSSMSAYYVSSKLVHAENSTVNRGQELKF